MKKMSLFLKKLDFFPPLPDQHCDDVKISMDLWSIVKLWNIQKFESFPGIKNGNNLEFSSNTEGATQKEVGWVTWKLELLLPSQDDIMRKHLRSGHQTHCMPRKQLPGHCCLRFGFMDNLTQSTKPTASVDNNSLSERQREGHPELKEVQCQPFFFYPFLLGSGVAGLPLSEGCSKRGRKILSHQGVHPVNGPRVDGGSIQPGVVKKKKLWRHPV